MAYSSPTTLQTLGGQQPSPRQGKPQRARRRDALAFTPTRQKGKEGHHLCSWAQRRSSRPELESPSKMQTASLSAVLLLVISYREHSSLLDSFKTTSSGFLLHTSSPGSLSPGGPKILKNRVFPCESSRTDAEDPGWFQSPSTAIFQNSL